MLYKKLAVIRAMAGGAYPILLHRSAKLLMSLVIWLMLLAVGEEAVRCHGFNKDLQRYDVHHAMAREISNKISDATNAWAMA